MPDHVKIEVRDAGDACVVGLEGELDLASAPVLVDRAEALLADGRRLVLDLRALTFIDSTGLGAIVGIDRSACRAGASLELVTGPEHIQRVFDLSGTTKAFTWVADPP